MENQRLTRRGFLQGLAAIAAGTSYASLAHSQEYEKSQYPIERFEKALDYRLEGVEESKRKELRENWAKASEEEKETLLLIYERPTQAYKRYSEDEKAEFAKFDPEKLDEKTRKKLQAQVPWKLFTKGKPITLADKEILIYLNSRDTENGK